MTVDVLDDFPGLADIFRIGLVIAHVPFLDAWVSSFVNVECVCCECGKAAAYVCLPEPSARVREVRHRAESPVALAEDAPRLIGAGYRAAYILRILYDRVCPEMGEILSLLLAVSSEGECLAICQGRAARAALVHQDDPVFLQRRSEPPVASIYRTIRLFSGAALKEEEISRFVPVCTRYDLTRVQGNLFAVWVGVIERNREEMISRGCRRASRRQNHA